MTERPAANWEIGIDIGGTFTDVVCRSSDGRFITLKTPTTREDPSIAVLKTLNALASDGVLTLAAIGRFTHGTTVATNAVLERKGARVGVIMTKGFRDVLEIGRQSRRQMYEPIVTTQTPVFLAPRSMRREVAERISRDGTVITPLDEDGLRAVVTELVEAGAEALSIVFLFSFVNKSHELRARDLIRQWYPNLTLSISSDVDPNFREYERTVTTTFDAYVKPCVDQYIENLETELAKAGVTAPLQIIQSRGGLTAATVARQRPIRLFLSGPAGGVIGGRIVGAASNISNLLTVDVGGTSADIALISDNKPLLRQEGLIDGFPIRVAMVDVNTLGAGGGSIARIDAAGGLRVGPDSAGSNPGPACYGRGGENATVTDASVVLGYIDPEYFAGGTFKLDPALAERVVEDGIAKPLGMNKYEAALGIHRVLNARMVEGIRLVSVQQGIDPRGFTLVPLGGAGGLHATSLAAELGMSRVLVPPVPGVLAAAGLLAAPVQHEVSTACSMPLDGLDAKAVRGILDDLDTEAAGLMSHENVSPDSIEITYAADVRFIGQSYNLVVPFEFTGTKLAAAIYASFLEAHERVYGHASELPAQIVGLRVVHQSGGSETIDNMRLPVSDGPIQIGTRQIYVTGSAGPVEAAVLERSAMPVGYTFSGPAIIQQADTTTLVEPDWTGRIEDSFNLILERKN